MCNHSTWGSPRPARSSATLGEGPHWNRVDQTGVVCHLKAAQMPDATPEGRRKEAVCLQIMG